MGNPGRCLTSGLKQMLASSEMPPRTRWLISPQPSSRFLADKLSTREGSFNEMIISAWIEETCILLEETNKQTNTLSFINIISLACLSQYEFHFMWENFPAPFPFFLSKNLATLIEVKI